MNYKFFDTSALLENPTKLFPSSSPIIISSITFQELEELKYKDGTRQKVQSLLRELKAHREEWELYIFRPTMLDRLQIDNSNNDIKILATALAYDTLVHPDQTIFITNDLAQARIANLFFGEDSIEDFYPRVEEYTGYCELTLTNEELAQLYTANPYTFLTNQYLLVRNELGEEVDILKWNGEKLVPIDTRPINTKWWGKISAFKGDAQQRMVIDSLHSNQLTVIRGCAASGKSYLGLGYMFSLLEQHKIDKLYIFCNPIASRDAAKLGFYPGSRFEKLLDSQIGNFLASKFGDSSYVEKMVEEDKLVLLPASDIRGVSISPNCGVYITEAQNSTIDLMKLMVQRLEEGTKAVIEGDDLAQVDLDSYNGSNNGLRRLVEVCKGSSLFGTVTLNQIHRSELAKLVNKM